MLRSAPAMDFGAVATAAQMPIRGLVLEVEHLRGRGRCDQLASSALTYPHITRPKKRHLLKHRACPPPVTMRSRWDTEIAARDTVPGTARWTRRSVDLTTAPRVAFTSLQAPLAALHIAEQGHCPAAIAVWLASGEPLCTERLAAITPHPAALAALIASTDNNTRRVAAERDDLPAALAAAARRKLGRR